MNIEDALKNLDKSYKLFYHKGNSMTKNRVKLILDYGVMKGYKTISEITDEEVDKLITPKQNENGY